MKLPNVSVTYTVEENALAIHYDGISDADTVFNPTNHAYFNLDGYNGEDCRNMLLKFQANHYLPVDELLIPTGEIAKVENTRFDFRSLRRIEDDFDHCFVVALDRAYRNICTLISEKSKIKMDIETDLPGIQFYTCSGCNEKAGKGGIPLHIHHAVALETQFFPDAPNHDNFPSTVLKKGEHFESDTKYIFSFHSNPFFLNRFPPSSLNTHLIHNNFHLFSHNVFTDSISFSFSFIADLHLSIR